MSESESHKRAKRKAPGSEEVPISGNRRLDSATRKTATEIERNQQNLVKAVKRLNDSRRSRKTLKVPHNLIDNAINAVEKNGGGITVTNLCGSKTVRVPKKR